jgi:hypothetical protein
LELPLLQPQGERHLLELLFLQPVAAAVAQLRLLVDQESEEM